MLFLWKEHKNPVISLFLHVFIPLYLSSHTHKEKGWVEVIMFHENSSNALLGNFDSCASLIFLSYPRRELFPKICFFTYACVFILVMALNSA